MAARYRLLVTVVLTLALGGMVSQAAFAASRPATPVIVSPTADTLDAGAAAITVTGTGTPGDTVYVNAFATKAAYAASAAADEKGYQDFESTGDAGGFGGAPGATVGPDGAWTYLVSSSTVTSNMRSGATYLTARQFQTSGRTADRYPVSATSPAVRIFTERRPSSAAPARPASGSAASPSVFSDLAAFDWRSFTPAHVAITAGAALVLTLVLGFPTSLLNSALETGYEARSKRLRRLVERVIGRWRRFRASSSRLAARAPKPITTLAWFLVAAIIGGFADPAFGFTLESLRLLVSLFLVFLVFEVLKAYVSWGMTRAVLQTPRPSLSARPSNLVILALAVLVSRLVHLEPALIVGAVIGLDHGAALAVNRKVRVILVGAAYSAVVGLLAWVGYSLISRTASDLASVTLREFLSQLTIAGIAALPITLLPFRSLDGATVFRWRRRAWGIGYAIGLLIFFFVLLPMPFSWTGVSEPLVAWVGLFVLYSVVAVLVWIAVRFRWFARRHPQTASPGAGG